MDDLTNFGTLADEIEGWTKGRSAMGTQEVLHALATVRRALDEQPRSGVFNGARVLASQP